MDFMTKEEFINESNIGMNPNKYFHIPSSKVIKNPK